MPRDEGAIASTLTLLTKAAIEAGMTITGDGRVSERDAAQLLGYSHGHLKLMRGEGTGPTAYGVGMDGCRVSYRLYDLALWIEERRIAT